MQNAATRNSTSTADLRQHFYNYFELLVGVERSNLSRAISVMSGKSARDELLIEIDLRINFLRGAVRMGRLLCLINQEEAKANLSMLNTERDLLRASVVGGQTRERGAVKDTSEYFDRIRKSLQSATQT